MSDFNIYPAVDAEHNFPQEIRTALMRSTEPWSAILEATEDQVPPLVASYIGSQPAVVAAAAAAVDANASIAALKSATILATGTNLNSLVTQGAYRQWAGQSASSLNFPVHGESTFIEVINGTYIQQTATLINLLYRRTIYKRVSTDGIIWGPWQTFNSTRTDQTAGRVIYQWDELNNREQLIHGDTGWRSLTPAGSGVDGSGEIRFRRVNHTVYMALFNLGVTALNSSDYLIESGAIPTGFQPEYSLHPVGIFNTVNANSAVPVSVVNSDRIRLVGRIAGVPGTGTSALRGQMSWNTINPWPTTLPGVSVSTVPSN